MLYYNFSEKFEYRLMDTKDTNYKKYQALVLGKNINSQSLIATDYLNHFNEIHMLLGMISDMPDCLDDIIEWKAITYQEHFKNSVFQDKELAIEAYRHSPEKYRLPFEACVGKMDHLLSNTIKQAEQNIRSGNIDALTSLITDYNPKMEQLIEECSAIINSTETTTQQKGIDDFFNDDIEENTPSSINQNSVDDLFD